MLLLTGCFNGLHLPPKRVECDDKVETVVVCVPLIDFYQPVNGILNERLRFDGLPAAVLPG